MTNSTVTVEKKLLHNMTQAVYDFNLIPKGTKVLCCLSGGKDSYTMTYLLNKMRIASGYRFKMHVFTLDQSQPGWQDDELKHWLETQALPYTILTEDTYSIVTDKIPQGKTYCSLCSRLRRGIIYRYAKENGYSHIALGHHRDDAITTLMMSLLYNGQVKSMPPKLLTDDQHHMVIRPMIYCQESEIAAYAKDQEFPIIPCNLCGAQENLKRQLTQKWIDDLAKTNPNTPNNLLHALGSISPSQMMDKTMWDFDALDAQLKSIEP